MTCGGFYLSPIHVEWYKVWRAHVRSIHTAIEVGLPSEGYSYAAVIAQGQYVCYEALYLAKQRVE